MGRDGSLAEEATAEDPTRHCWGTYLFSLSFWSQVGQGYPHDPPKVKCETMVYHPNIDLEGNVCLNILR